MDSIKAIQMSVQSAEVILAGKSLDPEILVNGTLMNVARGHIVLRIRNTECDHVGGIGELEIEASRPVMQAFIKVGHSKFERILNLLHGVLPRPASAVLALHEPLFVSSEGYLSLDDRRQFIISEISWSIPIL
jgi:hypothetical protein